jgi:hypothetical protein
LKVIQQIGRIRQIPDILESAESADQPCFIMPQPELLPEVQALLSDLLAGVQAILGDELIGFYLDGSLALGDFDPATSDVDFIAAIARPLTPTAFDALAALHRALRDSGRPFATELEGSYIPLPALRRHDPADATFANHERGPDEVLKYKAHHSDWVIHRTTIRQHGLALFGPPPATLIDPVSPDDVRRATADVLRSWWATPDAAEAIARAHPGYLVYVVQTMCRALYSLERGEVVSKPAAAAWALATLDERWRPLIERSLRWELSEETKDEMIAFVHYVSIG